MENGARFLKSLRKAEIRCPVPGKSVHPGLLPSKYQEDDFNSHFGC